MRSLAVLLLSAVPAAAEGMCETAWFARGLTLSLAGQCLDTPLGEAVFFEICDPEGAPTSEDEARLAEADDALELCEIDETATRIDLDAIETRLALAVHGLRSGEESSCADWRGEPVPLRAGPAEDYPVIARILPGQTIAHSYRSEGDWAFVAIWDETAGMAREQVAFGWYPFGAVDSALCGEIFG